MARVFSRERTFLDPVLRPDRAPALPAHRRGREARNALDGIRRRHAAVQRGVHAAAVSDAAGAGLPAVQSAEFGAVAPAHLAFNTAASFTTNTNWQAYSGETTMSYFTQMAGLAYHNFISAAVGIALAIAFIRGIARRQMQTIGNFWVDMVRACLWVLLPVLHRRRAVAGFAGRGAEPEALRHGEAGRAAAGAARRCRRQAGGRRQRQAGDGYRHHADHRAGAGGLAGDHQGMGHQWRRLLQCQQLASV